MSLAPIAPVRTQNSGAVAPIYADARVSTQNTRQTEQADTTAQATTPTADSKAGKPKEAGNTFGSVAGNLASLALPDALVYTNGLLRAGGNANFVLANPLTGSYTHFISHRNAPKVQFLGQAWGRVEAVHYDANGGGTRREDGLGFSVQNTDKSATFFFNIRAGDTNLVNSKNGASANVGFFGKPAALRGIAQSMQASSNASVRAVGKALAQVIRVADASNTEIGLAWRGQLIHDSKTNKLMLKISGVDTPLTVDFNSLKKAVETAKPVNEGSKPVAYRNNVESYVQGENPYKRAMDTRAKDGSFVNHGEPVAQIAGGIQRINLMLNPKAKPITNNQDAGLVLSHAIQRINLLTPEQIRGLTPEDRANLPSNPLTVEQSRVVLETVRLLKSYGLLGLLKAPNVEAFAKGMDTVQPKNARFVRDVFQGNFRPIAVGNYGLGNLLGDLAVGANRWVGIISGLYDGSPNNNGKVFERNKAATIAAREGFQERVRTHIGSATKALGIDVSEVPERERAGFEQRVQEGLFRALSGMAIANNKRPDAQALWDIFRGLSDEQRGALAARINLAASQP